MPKPIAITMGDPAGIGVEIIAALTQARDPSEILIIGDRAHAAKFMDVSGLQFLDIPCPSAIELGQGNPANAGSVKVWIEAAVALVQKGDARALLTAPINKAVLPEGTDFPFPGHTEFLAYLDGGATPVMMLTAEGTLRVVPVTIHHALADVPRLLTPSLLRQTLTITDQSLSRYLGKRPRMAVAALNPHAGEMGRMGREEIEWIAPLIEEMKQEGYLISGPHPADTLFHERARAAYDVAICMYHDQALVPIKTLAFDEGVNVTLGLSFLRASPDHGTAFDIAGRGLANPSSMIAAFDLLQAWT